MHNQFEVQPGYDLVMTSMVAPTPLEAVRQFVNTLDIESGSDRIGDPTGLRQWLSEQGLELKTTPTPSEVGRAITLREALREAMAANHDRSELPAEARDAINASATRSGLSVEFTADRRWRTTAHGQGVDGALGSLLAIVVGAMADGSWSRLKVCANDHCRWAFYDNSRARTAKWCSMQICGNRAKQRTWRDRRSTA